MKGLFSSPYGPLLSLLVLGSIFLTLRIEADSTHAPASAASIKALDFTNTFGANIHLGVNGYKDAHAIAEALNMIGFSRVRVSCRTSSDIDSLKSLAAESAAYFPAGLKANVLVTGYMNHLELTLQNQEELIPQVADLIETIEGPNEINNYQTGHGTHSPFDTTDETKNFAANYAAWAQALADFKKNTPALDQVKLLAPDIASGHQKDYASLPDVSAYVDSGTIHFYAGAGRQPSGFGGGNFSAIYNWYKAAATPNKPVSMTEWGQTTTVKPGGCDEATQARYVLNQVFDIGAKGLYRAYLYQLMDGTADGDPTGNEGSEAHFGIFDYQWHPKLAARALANVKSLLADTTTDFTPHVPNYKVTGVEHAGASGSRLAISKSDGSTFIVVWNEPAIWDKAKNEAITPPDDAVSVDFGAAYSYQVFDPLTGANPIATDHSSSLTLKLKGSPILIRLTP